MSKGTLVDKHHFLEGVGVPILPARHLGGSYEGGGRLRPSLFQGFTLPTNKNGAVVLRHGELPETEELVGGEWIPGAYNQVNEIAPNEVPVIRADPRARVVEKVSHIAA